MDEGKPDYSGPDLGSRRTGHIQFGRGPLRRLHRVSAEKEGTPEVHGKKDLRKHMPFQSVRLVGAVGIEHTTLAGTSRNTASRLVILVRSRPLNRISSNALQTVYRECPLSARHVEMVHSQNLKVTQSVSHAQLVVSLKLVAVAGIADTLKVFPTVWIPCPQSSN